MEVARLSIWIGSALLIRHQCSGSVAGGEQKRE